MDREESKKEKAHRKRNTENVMFLDYLENISISRLDYSVTESVDKLLKKLNEASEDVYESYQETNYYDLDIVNSIESELQNIFEAKIIILFKNIEINLKRILSIAYNVNFDKSSNWATSIAILKSKNININASGFPYEDINQLRLINNTIKHSHKEVSKDVTKIKEFQVNEPGPCANSYLTESVITYKSLHKFYQRIHLSPNIWLNKIGSAVYDDLYTFPDKRIFDMAEDLATKLSKKEADKLICNLKEYY